MMMIWGGSVALVLVKGGPAHLIQLAGLEALDDEADLRKVICS
jgi:hypothetical protein